MTHYALRFGFKASNNKAKYEALLAELRLASELGVKQLCIFRDSQLVINHVTEEYQAQDGSMSAYLAKVKKLLDDFIGYEIIQIHHIKNTKVDSLVQLASSFYIDLGRSILVEFLVSIEEYSLEVFPIGSEPTWMDPICDYLAHGVLPEDKAEAQRVQCRSSRYLIINKKLYKRGFSLPYLRCLTPNEADYVLCKC
ncbi:unnamed protein product [Prunus armeniaca]